MTVIKIKIRSLIHEYITILIPQMQFIQQELCTRIIQRTFYDFLFKKVIKVKNWAADRLKQNSRVEGSSFSHRFLSSFLSPFFFFLLRANLLKSLVEIQAPHHSRENVLFRMTCTKNLIYFMHTYFSRFYMMSKRQKEPFFSVWVRPGKH